MAKKEKTGAETKFIERLQMRGILRYKVFKNGVLIEDVEHKNLIVNGAREVMAKLVAGVFSGRNITKIAFGERGVLPNENDTDIQNPYEKNISSISFPAPGEVQFDWGLSKYEANRKAIYEFGLITDDGTLFARRIRENNDGNPASPINKEDDISIVGQWTLIF